MNQEKQLLVDTTQRILTDLCTADVIDSAEAGHFPRALWQTLSDSGLVLAGFPESLGGSGGDLQDCLLIISEAAAVCAPLPLAETFIAARLLQSAGGAVGSGPVTVASGYFVLDENRILHGSAKDVAFARWCEKVLVVAGRSGQSVLCLADLESLQVQEVNNIAGEPRDSVEGSVQLREDQVFLCDNEPLEMLHLLGAQTRSIMMAASLEKCLERSVEYALGRTQFGRPIAGFQAIQQQLAIFAGEVAACIRAASAVIDSAQHLDLTEIAIARARIGEAVGICTDIAHQVHGAMGYTLEHPLNHNTRRLWCWRDEYGNERFWQETLGRIVNAGCADDLWATVTKW